MNLTILLLLASLLTLTQLTGQTVEASITTSCQVRIGITAAPLFMQLDRINTTDDPGVDEIIALLEDAEDSALGYALGFGVQLPLDDRWDIDAGIQYAQKIQQIGQTGYSWPGDPSDPDILKATTKYNTHHIDIPLGIAVQLGKNKLSWLAGFGGIGSLYVKEVVVQNIKLNNGSEERTATKSETDYNTLNFSLYAKAGLKYAMNDRMHLEITPLVQYGLTRIIDNQPISAKMSHMGVQVGWYSCL